MPIHAGNNQGRCEFSRVERALSSIPPDLPRDTWAQIAMGLKAEFGDAGFELFDSWSQGDPEYKAQDARDTWRSINGHGGVQIGTVLMLAKRHGWQDDTKPPRLTPEEEAAKEAERAAKARAAKARAAAAQKAKENQEAEVKAQGIWDSATPATAAHGYLRRKHIQPHGTRVDRYGNLLVPVRDETGAIQSVQMIKPEKPGDGTDKYFLKGGKVTGGTFAIGTLDGAEAVCVAEGLATAASVHESTGLPAVVAFDAGRMRAAAKRIRSQYPAATIILCGDMGDAGKLAAAQAAQACGGIAVFTDDPGISDFNDLAVQEGPEAVRSIIMAALDKKDTGIEWRPGPDENPYRGTDDANAELLLNLHGRDLMFCAPWGKWLIWSGTHWQLDEDLSINRLAADVPRLLYRLAANEVGRDQRDYLADLARKLETTAKRNAFLEATKFRVAISAHGLSGGNWVLNCQNGTLDLCTGQLRRHRRADRLTHLVNIPYDPTATAPTWDRFLSDIFSADADLIRFVQRAIGYCLTGAVTEHVLFLCHGSGSNGKSVFLNLLRYLLGADPTQGTPGRDGEKKPKADTLSMQANPDLLMAGRHDRHPTEQADLYGRRVVVCQETQDGARLNESLVKQLTGGDAVRARRMREDFWEFNPTHKIWLSTNHKPEIRGTDHAIWRRIRLIPFDVTFRDDGEPRKDRDMERKLVAELPGILAWAVRGSLDWQREGLSAPAKVTQATQAYQEQMDVLAAWIGERCTIGKRMDARATALYKDYSDWCEANGERPEPQRKFGMRLTERGFSREHGMYGWKWIGIGMKQQDEEAEHGAPEKDREYF